MGLYIIQEVFGEDAYLQNQRMVWLRFGLDVRSIVLLKREGNA